MSEGVKTGLDFAVTGKEGFINSLGDVIEVLKEYEEAAKGGREETSRLAQAIKEADEKAAQAKDLKNLAEATANIANGASQQAEHVAQMARAFLDATEEAAAYGQAIDDNAQKLQFSRRAYQGWSFVLSRNGADANALLGVMTQLSKVQQGLTKTAGNDLAAVGLDFGSIENLNPEELFAAVINGLQGMDEGSEKAVIALHLLGSGYKQLLGLLNSSPEETQALFNQFEDLGGYMSDDAIEASKAYGDSLDDINLKWDSFMRSILVKAMPALADLREAFVNSDSLDVWAERVGNLADKGVELLTNLAEHGNEVVGTVEAIGAAWATWKGAEIVGKLVTNMRDLYGWIGLVANVLGISAGATAGGLVAGVAGVVAVADRIGDITGGVIGTLGDGHEVREYADNVAYLEKQVADLEAIRDNPETSGYWDFMQQDQLDMAILMLQNAREELEAVQAAAGQSAQTGITDQMTGVAAAAEDATAAAETIGEAQQTVASGAAEMLDTFETGVGEISTEFAEGVDEMSTAAAESMQNVNDVMAANSAVLSANAGVWGTDMMISFANGIILGYNDYVLEAVNSVAAGIEERLGFSEPELGPLSRFHTFAPDMMKLFAQGVRDYAPLVHDAVSEAFDLAPYMAYSPGGAAAGRSVTLEPGSVVIYGSEGQSADELYDVFSSRLAQAINEEGAVFG